jgi:hypothetical protein
MLRFLFDSVFHPAPENVTMRFHDETIFFERYIPATSPTVQALYADRISPRRDHSGNLVQDPLRPGWYGYMLELSDWYFRYDDIEGRLIELEHDFVRFRSGRSRIRRFVSSHIWPLCPALRTWFLARHRAEIRRFQVLEFAREVSVLKTLLELERKQQSSGGGRGGKRRRPTLPGHVIARTTPTSLSIH